VNSQEAKDILLLYRPAVDRHDPDFTEALALAQADPELSSWFQQHCAFQNAAASAFNSIPVPDGFKEQILSERRAHLTLSSRRKLLAAVSATVILACAGVFTFRSFQSRPPLDNSFANFQSSMIGKVLRYPKMDLLTNDLQAIRQELGQANLPFTAALDKTAGTGCAKLEWHDQHVSMVCFNSGKISPPTKPDLFLFVVDKSAVKNPPPAAPIIAHTKRSLVSGSWTSGGRVYVLAALGDEDFLKQYF
jgi:hypothetical protein